MSVIPICVSNPESIKNNLTKDECIKAMLDLEYKRSSKFWTSSFKGNSYVNWDIGVGAFANYFITENTYSIGGVALLYEFSGSKERRTLKSLEDYNDVLLDEQFMKKNRRHTIL